MIIKDNRIINNQNGGSYLEQNQESNSDKVELQSKLKETFDESLSFINSLLQKIETNKMNGENFDNMKELIEKLKLLNDKIQDTEINYQNEHGNRDEMMEAINTLSTNITSKVESGYNFQISSGANSKQIVFSEIIDSKESAQLANKIVINLEEKLNSLIDKLNMNTQENSLEIDKEVKELEDYYKSIQDKIKNIVEISKILKKINDAFKFNIVLDKIPLVELDLGKISSEADNKNADYFKDPSEIKNDYITYEGEVEEDNNELLSFDDQVRLINDSESKFVEEFKNIYDPEKLSKISDSKEQKGGSKLGPRLPKSGQSLSKSGQSLSKSGPSLPKSGQDNIKISDFINRNSNYSDIIRKLNGQINIIKDQIKPLKKQIMEFNLNYIHLYHNIKFMENYTNSNLLNTDKNTLHYRYLGKGIVAYYLNIIKEIEKAIKAKTQIGNYFYKYHYFNIQIVKQFLIGLQKINVWLWSGAYTSDTVKLKENNTISKMDLTKFTNTTENGKKMLNSIFIFNAFKDYLDEFQLSQANKVGVYLRINDWGVIKHEDKIFDITANEDGEKILDNESLNKCIKIGDNSNKELEIKSISSQASKVKFKQIFDPDSFTKNDILANYMSLPNFLAKGQSIMLITYGYSGVGKTYTIFGSTNPKLDGVLQTSLKQLISLNKPMFYRAYEIYGRAFPYKSYWEKQSCDYAHHINHFVINGETVSYNQKKPTPSNHKTCTVDEMQQFIYEINSDPQNNKNSFIPLDIDTLNTFEKIVSKIDDKRQEIGTIRRTINNRVSSRSIMVYDFKILLSPGTYVNFVVMDLPGKENIYETFVNTPSSKQYECIKVKGSSNNDSNKIIKAMAFMNPMSLMLNHDFVKHVNLNLIDRLSIKDVLVAGNDVPNNIDKYKTDKLMGSDNNNIVPLEIIKNIINGNDFNLLNEIYQKIFELDDRTGCNIGIEDCDNKCSSVSDFVLTPFEGYYINENIIGLLSSILNNLFLPNIIQEQQEIYMSLQNNQKIWSPNYGLTEEITRKFIPAVPNEVKMQTYFFRSLLRHQFASNSLLQNDYYKEAPFSTNIDGKNIITYKDWIEETYDYNKAYRKNKPPINEILKPYFDQIKNIYVFYVVSNKNPSKCDKQIKLISDSYDFLNILDMYTKAEEDILKNELTELIKMDEEKIINFLNKPNSLSKFNGYKNYEFIQFLEVLDMKNIKYNITNGFLSKI